MSRPPRPSSGQSTTGAPKTGRGAMDYMPSEFGNFVDRQRALAATELGLVSSGQEGDFAGILMELSALVAHVLAVYQDRYAGESFLGTARSARSLVRHGRRLGYEPDPGLAATGYLLLHVHDGLSGTVPRGFALASAPQGEKKAQDYETLQDVTVNHLHNELLVRNRMEPYTLYEPSTFEVHGTRLGLTAGDVIVIVTDVEGEQTAHFVKEVSESEERGTTRLVVEPPLNHEKVRPGFRLYARPAINTHLFGWDAPSLTYSEEELRSGEFIPNEQDGTGHGYVVSPYSDTELYLAAEVEKLQRDTPVVRLEEGTASAFLLEGHASRAVVFRKTVAVPVTTYIRGKDGEVTLSTSYVPQTNELASTVTAVQVTDSSQSPIWRKEQPIRTSRWLLGFQLTVDLVHERPSGEDVTLPVQLVGKVEGLAPGQLIALSHIEDVDEERGVEIAEITSVGIAGSRLPFGLKSRTVVAVDGLSSTIGFRVIEPATGGRAWKLGQLRIRGNVARISHGKTVEEVLGDSDGVTPFLRFPLKHAPLTHLPTPDGAAPELELRVGGVLWTRVADFYESDPYDRHYLLQRDEAGTTYVVFGDGRHGAIPPAGKKHLGARYRMGLGRTGNADPGQVDRVKKAHPLVKRAYNPTKLSGGTEPAGAEDVRTQATRFIRTFGRAVSVKDHADLALLYPGVARAVAHQAKLGADPETGEGGRLGIRVTVSDAAGDAPGGLAELLTFLDTRRDPVVPLEVVGPSIRDIELKVYLEIDRAWLTEAVQAAVRDTLYGEAGLFTFQGRSLGQPAYLSEVYAVLTAVPGVAFVKVTVFDLEAREWPAHVADVIQAQPGEWLRLRPERFGFSLPTETEEVP